MFFTKGKLYRLVATMTLPVLRKKDPEMSSIKLQLIYKLNITTFLITLCEIVVVRVLTAASYLAYETTF